MKTLDTNSPRILILTESVLITVTGFTAPHYAAALGVLHKTGTRIHVPPSMLPAQSSFALRCQCPECLSELTRPPSAITRYGHTLCQPCRQREGAYGDLIGKTIGRLTITGFAAPKASTTGGKRTRMTATCACGNDTTVWGQSIREAIRNDVTVSCGCYNLERTREMGLSNAGSSNGMYRHDISLEDRAKRRKFLKRVKATWAKRVRRRDAGKCVLCGSTADVAAHHLTGINSDPNLALTLENGVTLCRIHHEDFHCRFMGHVHAPVTAEDFARYAATITQSHRA